MLFLDKIQEKEAIIKPLFEQLYNLLIKNQSHSGDSLLVLESGFYSETVAKSHLKLKHPYVVGPDIIGHSENAHYKFINEYRTKFINQLPYSEYEKLFVWTRERAKEIDDLNHSEEMSIQLEMLVYLKFWESDAILRRFYELARIVNGHHYDWHYSIPTIRRSDFIIDNIINPLTAILPALGNIFAATYVPQVRNAIAHSNYWFSNRRIHLTNFEKGKSNKNLSRIDFIDWINIFHDNLIIHNEYLILKDKINEHYKSIALTNGNAIEILITDDKGTQSIDILEYRPNSDSWGFKV